MKIAAEQWPYLQGEKYTNSLRVNFIFDQDDFNYRTRFQILEQLSQNKNIIHIGFVDHTPESINQKLKRDKWLHARLCRVAKRCYGIDINQPSVDYVRNVLGYHDIECINILTEECPDIFEHQWDYLLIPDVLEHQNNPVQFLSAFAERFRNTAREIVITVPNGFAKENFKAAARNTEAINSDHRFWFTPYTLAKVISEAGLTIKDMRICRSGAIKSHSWLKNRYYAKRPLLRNNIVAVVQHS